MQNLARGLAELAEGYGLRDIYVFGSRATEVAERVGGKQPVADASASSDVDIGVQPERDRSLDARDRVRLTLALEDLLGARRVDLVVLSEASAFLAVEVIRGELLHTSDPLAQAEQELYVLRRAADLAPYRRDRVQEILNSGAR